MDYNHSERPQSHTRDRQSAKYPVVSILTTALTVCLVITLLSGGVAAQEESESETGTVEICENASSLVSLVNAVLQLSIIGGIIGMVVTYFGTNAVEGFPVGKDTKEKLRETRKRSLSAGIKVIAAGPLLFLLINFADLPWASCISLNPL